MGFKRQALEAGVEIYYPTPDEITLWIERSNVPAIWDELAKPWLDERYPGQNMAQKIQDELARIHAEVR